MNFEPLVSILMTAFNREKYISEAIESVLKSSYQNWELIIVDDKSKDNSFKIAQGYADLDKRIKLYRNEKNLGQFANRNKAAKYAVGKYIKYLDSDDIIYPNSLDIMVLAMEKNKNLGMGLSYNSYENEVPLPVIFTPRSTMTTHFFQKGILYIGPSGAIYDREYFVEIGGFKDYGVASDYEFNLRAALKRNIVLFQRDLIWWRIHDDQEFKIRDKEYLLKNHQIHESILKNKDFPLEDRKKREIRINLQTRGARKVLSYVFRIKVSYAIRIIRHFRLGPKSFLLAILPAGLRKLFI